VRTVVVTGSASGIGFAVRRKLEAQGDRVIGVDQHDAEVCADLSTAKGRTDAVAEIVDLADGRIDGLAVFAGVGPHLDPTLQAKVNYFASVTMLTALRPALELGTFPSAVVASSIAATCAPFDAALVQAMLDGDEPKSVALIGDAGIAYASAKRALACHVRRLAPEWIASGVRLNAIAPGSTNTALMAATMADPVWRERTESIPVPLGRFAEADEIAGAVLWMLNPDNTYLVGAFLVVDGGTDALVRPDQF
jgi:NAD(P)-dependent dehydrogenase (short-subunit alcohol dehydrogenase family)